MNLGGILSGASIRDAVMHGDITISPFDPDKIEYESRINPASYDLTLGHEVAVYTAPNHVDFRAVRSDGIPGTRIHPKNRFDPFYANPAENCLDAAKKNEVARFTMDKRGFVLMPGVGYLMHTAERIHTEKYVPIIDGKSSIGRLFCFVHVTAGYGDPGFNGQYTLEVVVLQPLIVYPGMRFCQMRFHTVVGKVESYSNRGHYKGSLAEGPIPSQSYKMFDEQGKS